MKNRDEVIKQVTIALRNHAEGGMDCPFNAWLKADCALDEQVAARKLRDSLLALSLGHDYCGNGSTGPMRREAARLAILAWDGEAGPNV